MFILLFITWSKIKRVLYRMKRNANIIRIFLKQLIVLGILKNICNVMKDIIGKSKIKSTEK